MTVLLPNRRRSRIRSILRWFFALWAVHPLMPAAAQELVSVAGNGTQGDSYSEEASVSANGRFVAFQSSAANFAAGDRPATRPFGDSEADIFVVDTQTGVIELISAGLDGLPANASREPALSGDGRYVAFESRATNLVPNDTNDAPDIFLFDRQNGTLVRINLGPNGEEADGLSSEAAISDDGRFVVFESTAPNLVSDDMNERRDVFLWSRESGSIERISIAHDGGDPDNISDQPRISATGRFIVFESNAMNLVPVDTNSRRDVFLFDRALGTMEIVDVAVDGAQSDATSRNPAVSSDGRYVAFDSGATNLVPDMLDSSSNIFVKDRQTGVVELISQSSSGVPADAFCEEPSMSTDGRFVAFDCPATSLVGTETGGTESIYLYDRVRRHMAIVSTNEEGEPGTARSYRPEIGADVVAFSSIAANLVPDDVNDEEDIFVVRLKIFADSFEVRPTP